MHGQRGEKNANYNCGRCSHRRTSRDDGESGSGPQVQKVSRGM